MKNATRMASLMGTWTGQYEITASIFGTYKMTVYFVMHIMPDPMRGYGLLSDDNSSHNNNHCNATTCNELDNHVCTVTKPENSDDDDDNYNYKCVNTEDEIVPWSDGTYYESWRFSP